MGRLFGTDGVRGIANYEVTPELAFNLGKAGAWVLGTRGRKPLFVIGRDARLSGDMLENAITAGILAVGGNVIKVDVLPTPAVAYLARYYEADAGVVISASHNPFEYNGIKFFKGNGYKLDDEVEEKIEDLIVRDIDTNEHITGENIGRCLDTAEDSAKLYADFLLSTIDGDLKGLKVVLDCANGASYRVAPHIYRTLGAEVTVIGDEPDGVNINDNIGSTHPELLQETVLKTGADIGLAFDGDADRLIVVDEKGRVIDGDQTICICAQMMQEAGVLDPPIITATVMSNLGLHHFANEKLNARVEVTGVGDRYVLESMRKTGSLIGGEQSGHIIFLNYTTTGDGILSSLQFVKAMRASGGRKASELADAVTLFPQVLMNAKVDNRNKLAFRDDAEVQEEIRRVEEELGEDGRVLIRPSGTEPLVRVMIEGKDQEKIQEMAEDLAALISRRFNA